MTITVTELQINLEEYLDMVKSEDIFITKNGKNIARLTSPIVDKHTILNHLEGILPHDQTINEDSFRKERLSKQ